MRPRVIVHMAVSADGRTDWFQTDARAFYDIVNGFDEDATLVSADTLLSTDEEVSAETTVEPAPIPEPGSERAGRPLLAVVDGRGRLRTWHHWLREPHWRGGVALCSASTPADYVDYLQAREIERFSAGEERVDLAAALDWIGERHGVRTVRVESGGTLTGALLRAGLVDEVSLLVHPALVGGTSPQTAFTAPDLEDANGVVSLSLEGVEQPRDGLVWLRYAVQRS